MSNRAIEPLQQLPLWLRPKATATHEQIGRIEKLAWIADGRLFQIQDTFPTYYTLHDREYTATPKKAPTPPARFAGHSPTPCHMAIFSHPAGNPMAAVSALSFDSNSFSRLRQW
uniref:Uncharacterized protein n=1 Tax=Candidatus Kentrum sp. FW TaxID=2126338 RepID=A0A450U006_9GAMM|nr:MAG: hypothetical protein BECKFW1821C_GA0114237_10812 [Candidatus Kentron sp. FW]